MKIEAEMAVVPFHESIQPVPSVRNRGMTAYGSYNRNRLSSVFIGAEDIRPGNNYGRLGENEKTLFSLGENVDIYV